MSICWLLMLLYIPHYKDADGTLGCPEGLIKWNINTFCTFAYCQVIFLSKNLRRILGMGTSIYNRIFSYTKNTFFSEMSHLSSEFKQGRCIFQFDCSSIKQFWKDKIHLFLSLFICFFSTSARCHPYWLAIWKSYLNIAALL